MSENIQNINAILNSINDRLLSIEDNLEVGSEESHTNVFILGLPRSGSTLATQIVFKNMDVRCTNNLMAKFWKAPLIGALLSEEIIGNTKETEYKSTHGVTNYPWEPHEFHWFWHELLGIDSKGENFSLSEIDIDWIGLKRKICSLNNFTKSAFVYKPMELVGNHLVDFLGLFKRAVYVYIERDDLEVAYSLAQVRLDKFGCLDKWWGSMPPENEMAFLRDKPYNVQIAGQVTYLKRMYMEKIPLVPQNKLVKTTYQTLCENPLDFLKEIRLKSALGGCEVSILSEPVKQSVSAKNRDAHIVSKLLAGFKEVESSM